MYFTDGTRQPLMFGLQILFQNGNCSGLAEYGSIIAVDRTGGRNDHACAGREKGGEINALVRILEERFGAHLRIAYLCCQLECQWIVGRVVGVFKFHEGTECDLCRKVSQCPGCLFKNIPIWRESLIAEGGRIFRAFGENSDDPFVSVKDGYRGNQNRERKRKWLMVKESYNG